MYRRLIGPVEDVLRDAEILIVSVNGPLAQIPFVILPAEPAETRAPQQTARRRVAADPSGRIHAIPPSGNRSVGGGSPLEAIFSLLRLTP